MFSYAQWLLDIDSNCPGTLHSKDSKENGLAARILKVKSLLSHSEKIQHMRTKRWIKRTFKSINIRIHLIYLLFLFCSSAMEKNKLYRRTSEPVYRCVFRMKSLPTKWKVEIACWWKHPDINPETRQYTPSKACVCCGFSEGLLKFFLWNSLTFYLFSKQHFYLTMTTFNMCA